MPLGYANLGTRIETFERTDGLHDWRLVAANGETVCQTSQGFTSQGDAERAAFRAKELMAEASVVRANTG